MQNDYFLDANLAKQLTETGVLCHDDEKCFWTDTYYSTDEEMENLYRDHGMELIDHFVQDGATPHFSKKVDEWSEEQFKVWCDYHYSICRQKSLLGASNHVVIVGSRFNYMFAIYESITDSCNYLKRARQRNCG